MPVTRRPLSLLLAALVVLRCAVFVFWPGSQFDSDQAVTGLMAKHLSELRAFPVFWYGQTYMLGVEAWLAAPVMLLFGATVTALKLPLLALNIAIALLLFGGFVGDAGLEVKRAAFATFFFVLAAPITSAHFVTANGGNVEPAFYVLLLWFLRRRPLWMGLTLGIGFLNREFTVYGVLALLLLDAADRSLFTRNAALRYAKALAMAGVVFAAVMTMRHFSSAAGPGTSLADLHDRLASNNVAQVAERLCLDGPAIARGAGQIFTVHWPELFGLEPQPLTDFGIESAIAQGLRGSAWLLFAVVGLPTLRAIMRRAPRGTSEPQHRSADSRFPIYLVTVAALSVAGYLVGRCGLVDFHTMRYELLSVLGACGLAAWYLQREQSAPLRGMWMAACALLFAVSVAAHVRLLHEYATSPPVPAKQELIDALDARRVRFAYADFWTAYYVTFLTRERIIVAADGVVKVRVYNRDVDAHRAEAIRIARKPCEGGEQLTSAFWSCPP